MSTTIDWNNRKGGIDWAIFADVIVYISALLTYDFAHRRHHARHDFTRKT